MLMIARILLPVQFQKPFGLASTALDSSFLRYLQVCFVQEESEEEEEE